jgi:hypothetical protein
MLHPHRVQQTLLFTSNPSEYLKLPKSTLQTQFAHGAKQNLESDFKFETEYLLDCSIPPVPPGAPIFLKDCLYDYFTNIVQVRRQLATPAPTPNFSTKPFFREGLPAYEGDGNGFYGKDKKRVEIVEERNVAAWQVPLLSQFAVDGVVFQVVAVLCAYVGGVRGCKAVGE